MAEGVIVVVLVVVCIIGLIGFVLHAIAGRWGAAQQEEVRRRYEEMRSSVPIPKKPKTEPAVTQQDKEAEFEEKYDDRMERNRLKKEAAERASEEARHIRLIRKGKEAREREEQAERIRQANIKAQEEFEQALGEVLGEGNLDGLKSLRGKGSVDIDEDYVRFIEFVEKNGFPSCSTCGTNLKCPRYRDCQYGVDYSRPDTAATGLAVKGWCPWCERSRTVKAAQANNDTARRQSIPQLVKREVWQRDGGKCVQCGSNEKLEFDHIIPVVKGGSNTVRNIQLLCETCNRTKSANI